MARHTNIEDWNCTLKANCTVKERSQIKESAEAEGKSVSRYMIDSALKKRKTKRNLIQEKKVLDSLAEITKAYNQYQAGVKCDDALSNMMKGVEELCQYLK